MAALRAIHIFWMLMVVAFATAFILPPGCSTPAQSEMTGIFSPASRSIHFLAGLVDRKLHPATPSDDGGPAVSRTVTSATPPVLRPPADVYEENHLLRGQLASLELKFDRLSQLETDRGAVGDILPLCVPATVTGAEPSGLREVLLISSLPDSTGLDKCPVVHGTDLVGRIYRSSITGMQVRLITDPGFTLTARIGRYVTGDDGKPAVKWIDRLQLLVQGAGHGSMVVAPSTISMRQATDSGININDFVYLDDREWPLNLQGFLIGRITAVRQQKNAPLFADIRIEPAADLMRLNEVMVMVREK